MPWYDPEGAYARLQRPIAILNAWLNEPDGPQHGDPLWLRTIFSYLEEGVDEAELVVGLAELSGILLVKLEKAGLDPQAVLQDVANRYRP